MASKMYELDNEMNFEMNIAARNMSTFAISECVKVTNIK